MKPRVIVITAMFGDHADAMMPAQSRILPMRPMRKRDVYLCRTATKRPDDRNMMVNTLLGQEALPRSTWKSSMNATKNHPEFRFVVMPKKADKSGQHCNVPATVHFVRHLQHHASCPPVGLLALQWVGA